MIIRALLISSVILIPSISRYSPPLTDREIYEIRGRWRLQLRELNSEIDKIEVQDTNGLKVD